MINYNTNLYDARKTVRSGKTCIEGTILYEYTESMTIKSKNGVDLRKVVVTKTNTAIELYMDGELINRYKSEKTAISMWKDFSA